MDNLFLIFVNSLRMLEDRQLDIGIYKQVFEYSLENLPDYINYVKNTPNTFALYVKKFCAENKYPFTDRLALSYMIDKILVIFADSGDQQISKDMMSLVGKIANSLGDKITEIIIVGNRNPSPEGRNAINTSSKHWFIQFFLDSELTSNPLECIYGARYEILSKEDTEKFLSDNNLTVSKIPIIFNSDPPIKWLGGKPGLLAKEFCETFLPGTMVKESLNYRIITSEKK